MSFKPGRIRPFPDAVERPKWFGAPKDPSGKPLDPKHPPAPPDHATTHREVAPGIGMKVPDALPNQRGKGGRPTGAQKRDTGTLQGAAKAIEDVRAKEPPTFEVPPRKKSWAKQFEADEAEVEQAEAQAVLNARQERVNAIKQETTLLAANRRIALGFSGVGLSLLSTLDLASRELQRRVKEDPAKLSIKEIHNTIATASKGIGQAQSGIEAMVRVERWILRHPLEDEEGEKGDDLDGIDAEGAKRILENLQRQLQHTSDQLKRTTQPVVVSEGSGEEPS